VVGLLTANGDATVTFVSQEGTVQVGAEPFDVSTVPLEPLINFPTGTELLAIIGPVMALLVMVVAHPTEVTGPVRLGSAAHGRMPDKL